MIVERFPPLDNDKKSYQCVLCKPKIKNIKAHASTLLHLKLHVSRQHGGSLKNFEAIVNQHSRLSKRPSGEDSKTPAGKRQTTIAAWASGAGSEALESGVDKRIVDFFVGNMLAFQVALLAPLLIK